MDDSRARGKGACGPDAERECRLVEATELRQAGGARRSYGTSYVELRQSHGQVTRLARRGKILPPYNPPSVAENSSLNKFAPNLRGGYATGRRKHASYENFWDD